MPARFWGCREAVISPYPEIGTDVDKPSDLELAQRLMGVVRRQSGSLAPPRHAARFYYGRKGEHATEWNSIYGLNGGSDDERIKRQQ